MNERPTFGGMEGVGARQLETRAILEIEDQDDDEKPLSLVRCFSADRLSEENAELQTVFNENPEVADVYFDLVSRLVVEQQADGSARFTIPETNFDVTVRVMNEGGKFWLTCEGPSASASHELGPHADSLETVMDGPYAVEDFQQLLADYSRYPQK